MSLHPNPLWHALYSVVSDTERLLAERQAAWNQLTAWVKMHPEQSADLQKTVVRAFATPLHRASQREEFQIRSAWLGWLGHQQKITRYFPPLSEVWVEDEDGTRRKGSLETTYGMGLYDFHFEYPVDGEGVPKHKIWVQHHGKSLNVVDYCRAEQVTVICARCMSDITDMGEPFACRIRSNPVEQLRQRLTRSDVSSAVLEEIPEAGLLLRMQPLAKPILLLWRWKIMLGEQSRTEIQKEAWRLANEHHADELWLLGRHMGREDLRIGFCRRDAQWFDIHDKNDSQLGWTTFDLLSLHETWQKQREAHEAHKERVRTQRKIAQTTKDDRLALPPPLGSRTWELDSLNFEILLEAKENRDSSTNLVLIEPGNGVLAKNKLQVLLPGMRKPEVAWRDGELTRGAQKYFEDMALVWAKGWNLLAQHGSEIRVWWRDTEAAWQACLREYEKQLADENQEREKLLHQLETGLLSQAEFSAALRGARDARTSHPGVERLQKLQTHLADTFGIHAEAWMVARFVDGLCLPQK